MTRREKCQSNCRCCLPAAELRVSDVVAARPEGLTVSEIAALMGESQTEVRRILAQAEKKFKARFVNLDRNNYRAK